MLNSVDSLIRLLQLCCFLTTVSMCIGIRDHRLLRGSSTATDVESFVPQASM